MPFFKRKLDPAVKGKNWESLEKSREIRNRFKSEFGGVPTSILVYDPKDQAMDEMSFSSYRKGAQVAKDPGKYHFGAYSVFQLSGQSCATGGLSRFPQNIGRVLVKFYCPEGGLVYDPFAGHNSRMQLVFESRRNYYGVDICKKFMKWNLKVRDRLVNCKGLLDDAQGLPSVELYLGNSAHVPLPDAIGDFTVTSPPYWNVEYYGDELEQLGNSKTYSKFLENLYDHIVENYRVLKPGAFCCWCINDFKRKGVYYAYHADLIPLFLKAGFLLHTIYIVDLKQSIQAAFVQSIVKQKAFPKRHEYCLVFKKGE